MPMYPKLTKNIMESTSKRTVLSQFARNANIEGINNAGRAPSKTRITVWLTIFVFLVALTINDVVQLVQEYLSNPVDVATTLKHEDTIDFPSVTVCNRNIVHCKRLKRFISDVCDGPNGNNKCQNRQALVSLQTLGKCEEDPLNLDQFKDLEKEESKIDDSDEMFRKRKTESSKSKETLQSNLQNQNQSESFKSNQDFLNTYLTLTDAEKKFVGKYWLLIG